MVKYLKYIFILTAALLLTACSVDVGNTYETSVPASALNESLDRFQFTCNLDGGKVNICHWGDGKSTYYYFLPSGKGLDALEVESHNGITLRKQDEPEENRVTFQNGDTLEGIQCNTTYLLGCYDMNHYLYEVPVVFTQGANIYSAFINTEGGSIAPVLEDKQQKLKGDLLISDPAGSVVYDGELTHIKGRGNGSWYSYKKPFNIKLSEKSDLLGMGTSREWCLINQELDYSCLRNKLLYDLAKKAGMPYTPDSEFVDLWIDGEYFGLYLLTDRINISEASVDITNLEKDTQAVNMEDLSDYPLVIDEANPEYGYSYSEIPNNPEDITGGYLLEVDKFYPGDKAARFHTKWVYSVTAKSPEYLSQAQLQYIETFVNEMESAICDLDDQKTYLNYIDIDSWANMCVFQEIAANHDFMGSSQFFYKDKDSDGVLSKLYAGPVWDMDLALGGESDNAVPINVLMTPSTVWMQFLYEKPEFFEKMLSAYTDTYRPLVQQMLDSEIDLLADKVEASASMNFTRWWGVAENGTGTTNPYRMSVEKVKDYLEKRVLFLDDLWVNQAEYHTVRVTTSKDIYADDTSYYFRNYMVPDGQPLGELKTPSAKEGFFFDGWYYGTPSNPGEAFDLNAPITGDCTIHAKYSPLPEN